MRDLIEFAQQTEVLDFLKAGFVESRPEGYQGVWVTRHPVWERLWLQEELSSRAPSLTRD
jgi:hypothetical protein